MHIFTYIVNTIFSFCSLEPGPRPQSGGRGAGPGTARCRFKARARCSGRSQKNMKIIRQTCDSRLSHHFIHFLLFLIFVSHFGVQDPDADPTNYILLILPFISCLYYSSIFSENIVFQPLHTDNLHNSCFPVSNHFVVSECVSA